MKFWDVIEILKNHPNRFDILAPFDIQDIPPKTWYIVKIVHYFPNKENRKRVYLYRQRFIHKDPFFTKEMIEDFEHQLKIKIDALKIS
jgi:hypothetical protein